MTEPISILLLEDRKTDAELVTRALQAADLEFVAVRVATESEFLAKLRHETPQLILADYALPAYDGLSALAVAQKECPHVPFIFVSGSLGEERAIETLHRGATDYVLKDHLARLGPAVRRALTERREMQMREKAEQAERDAQARYRALFEESPDGIVILDPETTRPIEFNAAACRQLGYSREEFAQLRLADIEAAETPEQTRTIIDGLCREGKRDFETFHRTRDGQIRHIHVTAQFLRVSGRPVYHCLWRDITERKQAELSLRESERRYRLLFNSGYDAVFVHSGTHESGAPGRFIEVNDIACRRLGYTRAELLQMGPLDIIAPETRADLPRIRARLATGKSAVSEGVHIAKDGRRIPVEISTQVFDLNGKPTRLSTVRDISERKLAEARLHLLGEALESAANAIVITDREGHINWANPAFGRLTGYSLEEVLGQKPALFKSGVHDQAFYRNLWETVQAGRVWSAEMTNRRKDGTLYDEENTITPVRNQRGEITHLIAVKQDITERKRMQEALQQREEYFRALTEQALDVTTVLTADGTIRYESPSVQQVFGYAPDEMVGRNCFEYIHPDDRPRAQQALADALAIPDSKTAIKLLFRHKDGSWRVLEATARNLCHNPAVNGLIINSRDATQRNKLEEALRESSEFNRQIINSAQEGLVVYGPDLTYQVWNPFMEQFTGIPAGEVLGRRPQDLFPFLRDAGVLTRIENSLTGQPGSPVELEFRIPRTGKGGWISHINGPLRNAAGQIIGVIGIVRDITAHKQAEVVLRESEERFRQMAETIESVFWMSNANLDRMLYVSPAYERIWGRTVASLYAHPESFLEAIHPEDRARVVAGLKQNLEKPEVFINEYRIVRPDGSVRWVRDRGFPIKNAAGTHERTVGIAEDITERKRDELRIAAFASLGQRLNEAKTAREAAEIIVGVADDLIGWDSCLFHAYSAPENRLSALLCMDVVNGQRTECVIPGFPRTPTEFCRRAIENGGQLILRDNPDAMPTDGLFFGDTKRPSASILFVPVNNGPKTVGVLSIQSYTPRAYDAYSLDTLQALASHAGGALERIRTQEALGESEASFRSVWEHSIDGMRLADGEGRILAVNEAFCRLVKLPRQKLVGQLFSVAYKNHGSADGLEVYRQRFASGQLIPLITTRAIMWDSTELDLEVSSSFIAGGRHEKTLFSIFRDISERKRAEVRLAAFSTLGHRLAVVKTAREAAEIITDVAGQLLGWDACSLGLYSRADDRMDHILNVDTIDGRRVESPPSHNHAQPSPLARRAILEGGYLILKEDPAQMLESGSPFGDQTRPSASLLFVPIRKGAEVVGLLSIHSYTPGAYDHHSLETLQALADHCGGALERIRFQEAWQATQLRLDRLLAQSPAVIYSLNTDGATTEHAWISDNVVRLLGYTVAEAQAPRGLLDQLHPEDRQALTDSLINLVAQNQITRDYRIRHKNGEYRWIRDDQRLVRDPAGAPLEIVGSWTDITDRKLAEQALQESERRFREMLETVELIAMTVDANARITFCNDYLLSLTGWKREEALGADWFSLFIPETDTELRKLFFDNMLTGRFPPHRENPIKTRGGELRQIVWNNTMLRDATGKVIGVASIGEDITGRKALEERLRQSQKMEAVGQLAGGVAHDFNNLLAVIRGNAELSLMDEAQLTPETREGLKHIVEASERAANLTRQLLAFSRKQVLQPQLLVLNDVIANLTKMLKRVIGENIDLQCHYASPLPHIQADPGMMEQIILNLVVNARDAMPHGGRLIVATELKRLNESFARLNPNARPGEFVCLAVSDTGTGIAPEVLPRIFEPFFTTKEIGKGTGLGLATVYGIVQQHQGWIEVSSQVNQGASFRVFLPSVPPPPPPTAAAGTGADLRGGTETILLVEDDHAVRMTTRRVLEMRGYQVREATTAREALEVWRVHPTGISLLLTDIVMPEEMSGRELANRLWTTHPRLKVVFMSGYSADVVGKNTDFLRRTKSHFLQKPCSSRTLLETVRRCLDDAPSPTPHNAADPK